MMLTPDEILDRTKAVQSLRPGVSWSMEPDGTITWSDPNSTQPTEDEISAAIVDPPLPPPPPVTPRQIRLALTHLGLRQQVEDYVNAQDIVVQDSWHYSTQFERDHPLILVCKTALNKTDADLDALFALAATL